MTEDELCLHDLDPRFCAVCRELHPLDMLLLQHLTSDRMGGINYKNPLQRALEGERGS